MQDSHSNNPEPQPLRIDTFQRRRRDRNGKVYDELEFEKTVSFLPNDAIKQEHLVNELFYDCNHSREFPSGGCCGEPGCFNVSCRDCFTRCLDCNVGLCLYHAHRVEMEGRITVLCSHCLNALQRRRFWSRFWRNILSPFVSFNDSK